MRVRRLSKVGVALGNIEQILRRRNFMALFMIVFIDDGPHSCQVVRMKVDEVSSKTYKWSNGVLMAAGQ